MTRTSLALLLVLLCTGPAALLPAQGNGATLLAKVDSYSDYNDIWGYTAPNGDEYAILGTTIGTAFYNCTDPANPYFVGFIGGPFSTWRDMKTYDEYAYIVTEGGGGMQIVSLANPEAPFLVKTWGESLWSNTHNIAIDLGAGMAYACGTNNGMRVLDLSDPENPTLAATYNNHYVHDLHVQNGQAHLAEIYSGRYRIVDVNNLPSFPTKDSVLTLGLFTHNAWANETDTIAVTTDESSGGRLGIYDISNPNNIQLEANFTVNGNAIIHNAYIRGDTMYAAWYTEGFVAVDISNPSSPTLKASYDTSPYGPGAGYEGAWGCYPFSPSGVVYISDREEGLHIIRVDGFPMQFTHAPLPNTQSEAGPYTVTSEITSLVNANITSADVFYRVGGGAWQSAAMSPTGNPDEWSGNIPGQISPIQVDYYLQASDDQGNTHWIPETTQAGDDVFSFLIGRLVTGYENDFEGLTDEGWTHGLVSTEDDWQRGVPQGKSGQSSRHQGTSWYDPDSAFSGSLCWGNDLGNGSNGSYSANVSNWLESPPIDCTGKTNTHLVFQRWLSVEGAAYDQARILVNGTMVWENPVGFTGDSFHVLDAYWRQQTYDISAIADNNPSVVVRFELTSDSKMELGGWAIDDVKLVSLQPSPGIDSILLTGPTSAPAGTSVTYDFSNAPANASYYLLRSSNLNGSILLGQPFDIGSPIKVVSSGTTDPAGNGSVTGTIPAAASGKTLYLEVGVDDGGVGYDSNPITLTIL